MGLLRAESAAVFGGADAQGVNERAAHCLRGAVAACSGGLLDPVGGVLEAAARRLEPGPVDVPAGRHAGLGGEGAGELARRQAGLPGQGFDGQVGAGVFGDPLLNLAKRGAVRDLPGAQ